MDSLESYSSTQCPTMPFPLPLPEDERWPIKQFELSYVQNPVITVRILSLEGRCLFCHKYVDERFPCRSIESNTNTTDAHLANAQLHNSALPFYDLEALGQSANSQDGSENNKMAKEFTKSKRQNQNREA